LFYCTEIGNTANYSLQTAHSASQGGCLTLRAAVVNMYVGQSEKTFQFFTS